MMLETNTRRPGMASGLAPKSKAARMPIEDMKLGIHSLVGCSLYSIQTAPKRSVSIEEINLASNESTAS